MTNPSKVVAVSSINAHSSPRRRRRRRDRQSIGSLVRPPGTPRASASRFAGSMVTTTQRRPWRAPAAPGPPPIVVLPTPPEPQHTTTSAVAISASSSLTVVARAALSDRSPDGSPGRSPAARWSHGRALVWTTSGSRSCSSSSASASRCDLASMKLAPRVAELGCVAQRRADRGEVGLQVVALVEGVDDDRPELQTTLVRARARSR